MTLSSPDSYLPVHAGTLAGALCPLFPDPARMTWTTFSSANNNLPQKFKDEAFKLGAFIAERHDNYCFGGMVVGLMGEVSRGVMHVKQQQNIPEDYKSAIISVPYHSYYDPQHDRYFQQIHVKKTLKEQQIHLNDQATHFVVLPGGIGTMSEFWHTMEELRWNESYKNKKLWLVNVDGVFDYLLAQIGAMIEQGLARKEDFSRMHVVASVEAMQEFFED
jgi:uncharacterized protein (TIGR00730 family)